MKEENHWEPTGRIVYDLTYKQPHKEVRMTPTNPSYKYRCEHKHDCGPTGENCHKHERPD